jgi:hypothetical protein
MWFYMNKFNPNSKEMKFEGPGFWGDDYGHLPSYTYRFGS